MIMCSYSHYKQKQTKPLAKPDLFLRTYLMQNASKGDALKKSVEASSSSGVLQD